MHLQQKLFQKEWECKIYKKSYEYNVDIHQLNTTYYKQEYDDSNRDKFTEIMKQVSYSYQHDTVKD